MKLDKILLGKRSSSSQSVLTENEMSPEMEQEILAEAEDAMKNGKSYSSAEEMFEDILKQV